jgi:hypothetical protein
VDFNVTREQWIDRFVMRMSILRTGSEPDAFAELARMLWPLRGQLPPEAAADSEFASHVMSDRFESTERFERTERIPAERR